MHDTSISVAPSRKPGLDQQRQEVIDQMTTVARDVDRLVEGLSESQFNWRPAPEKWSIGECLEHIATILHVWTAWREGEDEELLAGRVNALYDQIEATRKAWLAAERRARRPGQTGIKPKSQRQS